MNATINLICIAERSKVIKAAEFIQMIASRRIKLQLGKQYSIMHEDGTYSKLRLGEDSLSYFYRERILDERISREITPIFLVGRN